MKTKINFGTDGWRGIIADDFTFANVTHVSNAIGTYIQKHCLKDSPIFIGFDPRFLSEDFAKLCAQELSKFNLNIILSQEVVPTPVIAFHAATNKSNGAIEFTASHNPPQYCGLKYITNYGGPAPEEITNLITSYINEEQQIPSSDNKQGNIKSFAPKEAYFKHIETIIDFKKIKEADLHVAYDPLYGAGIGYLDELLRIAGCKVQTIHDKLDPTFGGLLPEPREEFLNDLKDITIKKSCNLGLATDGDADRISAIDSDAIFFTPNKIAPMLLRHLKKNKGLTGAVVRARSATHLLDRLADSYNLKTIETKVGFKWLAEAMLKNDTLLAAEESGGISIKNHIPDKDAVLAGMLIVEMLAYEKKTLAEIYKDTLEDAKWSCINERYDLNTHGTKRNNFISALNTLDIKEVNGIKTKTKDTTEGIKVEFEDGSWFFARESGTEPMTRVYFETGSTDMLHAMKCLIDKIHNESESF